VSIRRDPTMAELRRVILLSANEDTVIVGGMAVSLLAEVYGVSSETPCMTTDGDYLGGTLALEESERKLAGFTVRKYLATLDDQATPNSGRLAVEIGPDVEPIGLDFLFRIDGMSTDEVEQKAVSVEVDGKPVRVMHPVLLLESKIGNLAMYPAKRNVAGINQALLAIRIAEAYLEQCLRQDDAQRPVLVVVERLARFAQREAACYVYKAFGLDVMDAVPEAVTRFGPPFASKRWPQIQKAIADRRAKFDRLWERMAVVSGPKVRRFRP